MLDVKAIEPVPVILDTDIGGDIDDTWALAMLLGCPAVDLQLVVTAFQDTYERTRLATKLLDTLGRSDIPVGIGIKTSEGPIQQSPWIGDYDLSNYPGTLYEDGVQALIDAIHQAPEGVVLCTIGPETNLKAALERDPSIAEKARIVAMAGGVFRGYGNSPQPQPEWNIMADVAAAQAVFAAPWKITWAPLDTCGLIVLEGEQFEEVKQSNCPLAQAVIANYAVWARKPAEELERSSVLFDTEAAYLCFDESLCLMHTVPLALNDKGLSYPDASGKPVDCALAWRDFDQFKQLVVDCICGKHL